MLQKSQELIDEIIKDINKLSGKHGSAEIFSDWVTMIALKIQHNCYIYQFERNKWHEEERIDAYNSILAKHKRITDKYNEKELNIFFKMYDNFKSALETEIWDYLGEIFMGLSNSPDKKKMGQCFTPFNLSVLIARLSVGEEVNGEKPFTINEPTCGAGGMIIAMAKTLWDKNINPQKCMVVVAQDLSLLCVYMTYVQLSMLGINAKVAQGDVLSEPYIENYPKDRVFETPKCLGMF